MKSCKELFEVGIPSSEVYPSAEIYHIGTPSERPTSEGFRSAVSHGTSSVPSHPTSSPGCCRHFDTPRTSFKGSSEGCSILL